MHAVCYIGQSKEQNTCSLKKLGIKEVKTKVHMANNGETSTWQVGRPFQRQPEINHLMHWASNTDWFDIFNSHLSKGQFDSVAWTGIAAILYQTFTNSTWLIIKVKVVKDCYKVYKYVRSLNLNVLWSATSYELHFGAQA